jgi:hypothetical protein
MASGLHAGGGEWGAGFFIPTDRTEPARSGTGLPVRFGREPVGNRTNSNLNSNNAVQSGPTGIPTILTGIPDRFPVVEKKRISVEFDVFSNLN